MKKFSIIIIAASLMMAACANSERKTENQSENQNETKEMKTLVAYFSASGVTRGVATQLAEVAGADLYEIVPEQIYTDADLDWRDSLSRSSVEMKDKTSRPSIKKTELKYTCPTIINTFMETYDFAGKTVIPFATSGSSPIEQACSDLKSAYPKANWKEGRLLNNATKEQLEEWVKSLQ